MKTDITNYIKECEVCQRNKPEHISPPGLLQPIAIPEQSWEVISMDFIEGLPTSKGRNVILVIVDKLTKYCHLIALSHPYTAQMVAQEVLNSVVKLHGVPKAIISDKDPIFVSSLWKELFSALGTKLKLSSAYHPQSDRQTERVNQFIEMYLRCMIGHRPTEWSNWLPLAEWWYNTNHHSALGMSPYQALYAQPPPSVNYQYVRTKDTSVNDMMQRRWSTQQLVKENLIKAQERMKWYADKGRTDREFSVGDEVFLKLQPYRQHSLVTGNTL